MGTNYYWHEPDTNKCEHCGRYDEGEITHIGKSSYGWTFTFHGTDKIRSYNDWLAIFVEEDGKILDEDYYPVTISDFTDMVEAKKNEKRNHTTFSRDRYRLNTWFDKDGHSFSGEEFS